jgi:hypothetical protein
MSSRRKKAQRRRRNKARQVRAEAARRVAPAPPQASLPEEAPDVRWKAEDPAATWWDDVWPFKDELGESTGTYDDPEEERDDEPEDEPVRPPHEDTSTTDVHPVLAYTPPRDAGRAGPPTPLLVLDEDWAPWVRRLATAAVVAAAVVIIGVVAWKMTRPAPEVAAQLAHGNQYQPPHALRRDTSFVQSRIGPGGVVQVTHWIRTGKDVREVQVRTPQVPGLHADDVYMIHLVVAGDGIRLPVTQGIHPGLTTTIPVPPTRHLFVRYHLAGVLDYADGAHERALARITALDVSTPRRLAHATQAVTGARVLALACDPPGRAVAVPCGRKDGGTWRAVLGPGEQDTRVMAQIDLPREGQR